MTRTLPAWIELRRDRITESWLLVCRACGIKEHYAKFWPASYAAHEHADMHAAELDERIESSQLRWLGPQVGASVSPRVFCKGFRGVVTSRFLRGCRAAGLTLTLRGVWGGAPLPPQVKGTVGPSARSLLRGPGACLRRRGSILEWTVPFRSARMLSR